MTASDDPEELLDDEPVEGDAEAEPDRRRRRLERVVPVVLKRALERGLEAGLGTLVNGGEAIRGAVGDVAPLPKELVGYAFSQVDDTKNAVVRVVAKEVRDFLEATDLNVEIQKALTALSFEIRTEIRFIPNDKGGIRPQVKAEVEPKSKKKRASLWPRRRQSEAEADAPPAADDDATDES